MRRRNRLMLAAQTTVALMLAAALSASLAFAQQNQNAQDGAQAAPAQPSGRANQEQSQAQQQHQQRAEQQNQAALGVDVASSPRGVIVTHVRERSPADKVGLRPGDQIVSFAGEDVSTAQDLLSLIRDQEPESTVKAGVIRNGERVDMAIVLGTGETAIDTDVTDRQARQPQRRQTQRGQEDAPQTPRTERRAPQFGPPQDRPPRVTVTETPGERQRQTARYQPPAVWAGFILERAPLGVVVERIHPRGPAAQAGLRAGDRIVKVNGRVVAEPDEVYQAIDQQQAGDSLQLTVLRRESLVDFTVSLEAPPPEVFESPVNGGLPPTGPGMNGPDFARVLVQQQRQNAEMLRQLMQEVQTLRQEIEELKASGGSAGNAQQTVPRGIQTPQTPPARPAENR